MIKFDVKPFDINNIQVYDPTSDSNDEELDKFYSALETAMDVRELRRRAIYYD